MFFLKSCWPCSQIVICTCHSIVVDSYNASQVSTSPLSGHGVSGVVAEDENPLVWAPPPMSVCTVVSATMNVVPSFCISSGGPEKYAIRSMTCIELSAPTLLGHLLGGGRDCFKNTEI